MPPPTIVPVPLKRKESASENSSFYIGSNLLYSVTLSLIGIGFLFVFAKREIYNSWNAVYFSSPPNPLFYPSVYDNPQSLHNLSIVPISISTKAAYFVDVYVTAEMINAKPTTPWTMATSVGLHPSSCAPYLAFLALVKGLIKPDRIGDVILCSVFLIIFFINGPLGVLAWNEAQIAAIQSANGQKVTPNSGGLYSFVVLLILIFAAPVMCFFSNMRAADMKQRAYSLRIAVVCLLYLSFCLFFNNIVYDSLLLPLVLSNETPLIIKVFIRTVVQFFIKELATELAWQSTKVLNNRCHVDTRGFIFYSYPIAFMTSASRLCKAQATPLSLVSSWNLEVSSVCSRRHTPFFKARLQANCIGGSASRSHGSLPTFTVVEIRSQRPSPRPHFLRPQ